MSSIQCTICLSPINLQDDEVHATTCGHIFHRTCLTQALRTLPSCPQCRKQYVHHFQLFFSIENDEEAAGACGRSNDTIYLALTQQISQLSNKLDRISGNSSSVRGREIFNNVADAGDNQNLIEQLQRENQDLREILEMEKILSTNTEKEIDQLRLEIRERNDLINSMQVQNELLKEETRLYEPRAPVAVENLLDLP